MAGGYLEFDEVPLALLLCSLSVLLLGSNVSINARRPLQGFFPQPPLDLQ